MGRLKNMERPLCCVFIIVLSFLSPAFGQPFPIFAQNQQDQVNPLTVQQQTNRQATTQLSSQFLQNGQPNGLGTAGRANTRTQQIRTVTVPVLPAPEDLTSQLGQQLQDGGPVPRFAPGSGQIGRPFTWFGPSQADPTGALARRRQMMLMQQQQAAQQAAQQTNGAQAGMTAAGRRFQGLATSMQQQQPVFSQSFPVLTPRMQGQPTPLLRPQQTGASPQQFMAQQAGFPQQQSGVSPNQLMAQQAGFLQQQQGASPQQLMAQQTGFPQQQSGVSPQQLMAQQAGFRQQQAGASTQQLQAQQAGLLQQQPAAINQQLMAQQAGLRQQQNGASVQQSQAQQARVNAFPAGAQNFVQNQQQAVATQQQTQAQQVRPNTLNRGIAQQTGAQNQQGQAGPLWRPDVRMPGMIGAPAGGFPPATFPGMFPPGRVNGQSRFTGTANTATQDIQMGAPVINPRDPRVGMMPAVASLAGFGSRQRPFPTGTNGGANRVNTATRTQTGQRNVANRGQGTAQGNQQMVPGAFPGGRMASGMQAAQRAQMAAMANRRAQQQAMMARANMRAAAGQGRNAGNNMVPQGVGAFPGGQTPPNPMVPQGVAAFPGGQAFSNAVVPPAVDAFPGTAGATGNEVSLNVAAFPGSETSAVDTSVSTNELPTDVASFPGAEPDINLPNNVPGFPGTEPVGFDSSNVSGFPGAEAGLLPGELPPPPPVFPASDITKIPSSADADLFPPMSFGGDASSISSAASETMTSIGTSGVSTSGTSFEMPRPVVGGASSTVDVSVVESSRSLASNNQAFPGGIDNAPTKEGNIPRNANPQTFPGSSTSDMAAFPGGTTFDMNAFPGGPASEMTAFNMGSASPDSGVSGFSSVDTSIGMSSFPNGDLDVPAFPNVDTPPMFPGVDMSAFPGSDAASNFQGDSSNIGAFPSFPSINGPPETPAFPGVDSGRRDAGSSSKTTTVTRTVTTKKVSIRPGEEGAASISSFPVGNTGSGTDSGVPVGAFPGGSDVAPGISGVPIHIWDPSASGF